MPLYVVRNDITKMHVDVIVDEASAGLETDEAVITEGYTLPAKYVIHAAGPVYEDGLHGEVVLLRSYYVNALDLAKKLGCESIAFPLISSGIYGYPKDEALTVATNTIGDWLMRNDMDVSLVVSDKSAFSLSYELLSDVKAFIDGVETLTVAEPRMPEYIRKSLPDDVVGKLDDPFSATLLRLIDAKGKTDVEIYKRANIDRKLFSKIRAGRGYMPSKKTAVALAVALELSIPETRDLLERAGFALSRSVMFDVIIEYFLSKRRYDIFEINNVLFEYDQQLLGG